CAAWQVGHNTRSGRWGNTAGACLGRRCAAILLRALGRVKGLCTIFDHLPVCWPIADLRLATPAHRRAAPQNRPYHARDAPGPPSTLATRPGALDALSDILGAAGHPSQPRL